eukprot:CAMPEP_0172747842 /NCGR_PEP_ID=MMETSP1074-20121228/143742_1 /TAXON_ID=2916 /ORGANISM="Ceratium fusus, Strain PA161109" /LENGTH=90 /DNA_ID=CAMNT_0013579463 /DNA_START=150 /DNA_END=419 /DNA_ORIENTATION=+
MYVMVPTETPLHGEEHQAYYIQGDQITVIEDFCRGKAQATTVDAHHHTEKHVKSEPVAHLFGKCHLVKQPLHFAMFQPSIEATLCVNYVR